MTINTIVTIVIIVLTLVMFGIGIYFYLKYKTLDDIRADVYQKFREAEKKKIFTTGKQKMKWVLQQARSLLPNWAQALISDACLEKIVQRWFDAIKDILDDGQLNKSHIKEDESNENV